MTDSSSDVTADTAPVPPTAASAPSPRASGQPKPASMLERAGWVVLTLGVLVLVYFALTR